MTDLKELAAELRAHLLELGYTSNGTALHLLGKIEQAIAERDAAKASLAAAEARVAELGGE